jgi:hypothetical protein
MRQSRCGEKFASRHLLNTDPAESGCSNGALRQLLPCCRLNMYDQAAATCLMLGGGLNTIGESVSVKVARRITVCVGAAAWMMAAFGGGIAEAKDSLAGITYAEAAAKVSKWGGKVIISTVVGDAVETDKCIVTSSRKTSFVKGDNFDHESGYLVALDCNAKLASAGSPGNSAASPAGREQKHAQKTAKWMNSDNGRQWCAKNVDDCKRWCDRYEGLCSEETMSIFS